MEFGLTGDLFVKHTASRNNLHPQGGIVGLDPRLVAATTRAPAASREDSCPQDILKVQPHNNFDYGVCYKPQLVEAII